MARKKKNESIEQHIEREQFTRQLRVELTPAEIADRADRAAHMVSDIALKERELKEYQKHARSVIGELEAEHFRLSTEVRNKSTYKDISCDRLYNFTAGTVSEVRTDTGEVLETRPMTPAEAQRGLPFDNGDGGIDDEFSGDGGGEEAAE